jgi:hypothetical protein
MPAVQPHLDVVMVFGFYTAILTLLCFEHRKRSINAYMAMSVCLAGMTAYAFLQGAWPLGMVESVMSVAAAREYFQRRQDRFSRPLHLHLVARREIRHILAAESRVSRLFGEN